MRVRRPLTGFAFLKTVITCAKVICYLDDRYEKYTIANPGDNRRIGLIEQRAHFLCPLD